MKKNKKTNRKQRANVKKKNKNKNMNNKTCKNVIIFTVVLYLILVYLQMSPNILNFFHISIIGENYLITNTTIKIISGFILLINLAVPIICLLQPYIPKFSNNFLTLCETIVYIILILISVIVSYIHIQDILYFSICAVILLIVNYIFELILGKNVYKELGFIKTFLILIINLLILLFMLLNIGMNFPFSFYILFFTTILMGLFKMVSKKAMDQDNFIRITHSFIVAFICLIFGTIIARYVALYVNNFIYKYLLSHISSFIIYEQIDAYFITFGYSLFSYFIINILFNKGGEEDKYIKRGNLIINFIFLISMLVLISIINIDTIIKLFYTEYSNEIKESFEVLLNKTEFSLSLIALFIAYKDIRDKLI